MLLNPFLFLLLLIGSLFVPHKSKSSIILSSLIALAYFLILYKSTTWAEYGSYYIKYFFIIVLLGYFSILIKKSKKLNWVSSPYNLKWLLKSAQYLLLLIFSFLVYNILINPDYGEFDSVDIDFPLKKGVYYIAQGGRGITNNHNEITELFALDIIKLNKYGIPWNGALFIPKENNAHNIFKDTIYSPCDGIITNSEDQYPDHTSGNISNFTNYNANNIEIKISNGYRIVLAHLLKNSLFVKKGDSIHVGQPIGLVGNSGFSKAPHLHIHAYNFELSKDGLIGESIQLLVNGKSLNKNDVIEN